MEIFLVSAYWNYEGSNAVMAFAERADADALVERCDAYRATKPPCPQDMIDTPENDKEWQDWYELNGKWDDAHPAGREHSSADGFMVTTIQLVEKGGAGAAPAHPGEEGKGD